MRSARTAIYLAVGKQRYRWLRGGQVERDTHDDQHSTYGISTHMTTYPALILIFVIILGIRRDNTTVKIEERKQYASSGARGKFS